MVLFFVIVVSHRITAILTHQKIQYTMGRTPRSAKRTLAATEHRKRKKRTKEAVRKSRERIKRRWELGHEQFEHFSQDLRGDQGKSRTFEENHFYLLAMKAALRRIMVSEEENISWRSIEEEICSDFFVGRNYLEPLRKGFLNDGDVYTFGGSSRGVK